ncbi:glucose-6-phosphate dehydrogenase [Desulfovibrionales bacterium]
MTEPGPDILSDLTHTAPNRPAVSAHLIIFGATGDLAVRKIYPALASLCHNELLSPAMRIVAVGRKTHDTSAYLHDLRPRLEPVIPSPCLENLLPRITYLRMDPSEPGAGAELAALLDSMDTDQPQTRIFYFAVPPSAYAPLAMRLGEAGLGREKQGQAVRLIVEKPFGRDLTTARELDWILHHFFSEHQIFRIDHYMAKETVQNVLFLRFANVFFEPLWNRHYIDHVSITAAESLGVGRRAEFYDQTGVLRDMFQNHMMMLLALCAMEPPSFFKAELVRDERSKVYRALRSLDIGHLQENLVLGQYGPGAVDGQPVPGYRQESGIAPDSTTPTFAWMRVFLDNWRWQGVPFYLCSGKRLAEKRTEIAIHFKNVPVSMFRHNSALHIPANRLILGMYPDEVVRLEVQTKGYDGHAITHTQAMDFEYGAQTTGRVNDYAKVLLDCIIGDQTLFWRQDAVELCWSFLTPILEHCTCPEHNVPLQLYPAGSSGPDIPFPSKAQIVAQTP